MSRRDAGVQAVRADARGWRQLALAALIMALSMAVAAFLIPPDPDVSVPVREASDR